ncbi:MAG TPA: type II toxin-antitoxin system HicB family antitoxin [Candidatus Acetothermia bacterium]|nr:type II toxin-antitoxin system HicB family antitoxin [Candidatus Acetothermia bacterium]
MNRRFKVIVEKTKDGYVAYPVGLQGVVVSDGNTVEEAVANLKSAIVFHLETFGKDALGELLSPEAVYLTEAEVAVDVQFSA